MEACVAAIVLICVLSANSQKLQAGSHNYTYVAAMQIAEFAKTHPGRYAMGDRGAIVGYLLARLGDPMVQTEGIVMDRNFIATIQSQADLISTLQQYHVDYYIATNPGFENNCYHLEEPSYAGNFSPKMRSVVCAKPYYSFSNPSNNVFVIPHVPSQASLTRSQ